MLYLAATDFLAEQKNSAAAKKLLGTAKPLFDFSFRAKEASASLRLFEIPAKTGPSRILATVDSQDPLFEIDAFSASKFEKSLADLRSARPLDSGKRYAIREILIERVGRAPYRRIARKADDGAWTIVEKKAEEEISLPAARGRLEAMLDQLSDKTIIGFAPAGDVRPSGDVLRLKFQDSEWEFWQLGGRIYSRDRLARPSETFEMNGSFAASLPWDERFLTDPSFGPAPKDRAPAVPSAEKNAHQDHDGHGH